MNSNLVDSSPSQASEFVSTGTVLCVLVFVVSQDILLVMHSPSYFDISPQCSEQLTKGKEKLAHGFTYPRITGRHYLRRQVGV